MRAGVVILLMLVLACSLAQAQSFPVQSVGGVSLPGVPPSITREAARAGSASRDDSPPMRSAPGSADDGDDRVSITVTPGATEMVRVATGYLNRIITPFENPKLLSANALEVQKEGSSLYVAGPADRPAGVYILSNDPEDTRGISLTLIPAKIPPRTLTLKWPDGASVGAVSGSSERAKRWEESASYEETLLELVEAVARGEIPEGYSLSSTTLGPTCVQPGITYAQGQRLTGSHFSAFVLRATNISHSVIELAETAGCNVAGVVLVAPWPNARLESGASTELYVVVRNDVFDPPPASRVRQSLLAH
jgi:conjugal transfer pilus assembly protein TraK